MESEFNRKVPQIKVMLCYMHVVIGKISVLQCIAWIHGKNKKQRTPPSNPRVGQEANMTVITKRAVVLIGKKVFLQKSARHTRLTKKKALGWAIRLWVRLPS